MDALSFTTALLRALLAACQGCVFDDAPVGDAVITTQESESLNLLVRGAADEQAGASGRFELGDSAGVGSVGMGNERPFFRH